MTRVSRILVLVALSGCATHHARKPSVPEPASTDWAAVRALPRGSFVFVGSETSHSHIHEGYVWEVTGDAVTTCQIAGTPRCSPTVVARGDVTRVTVRKQVEATKRRDAFIGIPIASAFLGGLTGMAIGRVQHDKKLAEASGWMFFGSLMASEAVCVMNTLSRPKAKFEDRVVYVRP